MTTGTGLVGMLLEGIGLPAKRLAQACLVLLMAVYWLSPATFHVGLSAWANARAEQAAAPLVAYIERLGSTATTWDEPAAPSEQETP